MKSFLYRRVFAPILALLKQGVEPRELAWALAAGTAIGVIPALGTSTSLCLIVATVFGLNQVAIQLASWICYPLQLAVLIPFLRLGERIFSTDPVPLAIPAMLQLFRDSPRAFFSAYGATAWHGAIAWAVVVPLPTLLLQFVLRVWLQRAAQRLRAKGEAESHNDT